MTVQPSRTALHRAIRRQIVQVAAEAAAERHHHRTRPRARGDRSCSFWDDDDRFALALMATIRNQNDYSSVRFGTGASNWGAARHAAALAAPGNGQRVRYVHRMVDGVFKARPQFHAGPESHDTAARRLARKHRQLQGLPATWVCICSSMLGIINSPIEGASRRHARAMLGLLGWRDLPLGVWDRLDQLMTPSKINGLDDVLPNDRTPPNADDRLQPRSAAGAADMLAAGATEGTATGSADAGFSWDEIVAGFNSTLPSAATAHQGQAAAGQQAAAASAQNDAGFSWDDIVAEHNAALFGAKDNEGTR